MVSYINTRQLRAENKKEPHNGITHKNVRCSENEKVEEKLYRFENNQFLININESTT